MGTSDYATIIFEGLINDKNFEVVGVFTQEDKKVGRKQILTPPHIKRYILEKNLNIPIYQPKTLKEDSVVEVLKKLKPDFIVVAAYGQILPKSVLEVATCINLHASILPKYRGASPIQDAIKNGDELSGVSAMLMEEGLDSGDILGYSFINIKNLNAIELFEKLSFLARDLCLKVLKEFDEILPIKQNSLKKSYCKKIKKEDGKIVFDDAKRIYQKYLAYIFWPGIFLESSLKLKKIELEEEDSVNVAGEILKIEKDFVIVGCKRGSLKIIDVQPASKKQMSAVEYIRGKRLVVGDSLF